MPDIPSIRVVTRADVVIDRGTRLCAGRGRARTHEARGGHTMLRRIALGAVACLIAALAAQDASAQQAYGRAWGHTYTAQDWNRFYHYPYVYYPQNYWGSEYYRSADSLYHRYPPEMRIPVYNRHWHNYYPSDRKFHAGHHFVLDVF